MSRYPPRPTRQLTIPAALGRSVANHDDEEKDVVSTPVVYCLKVFKYVAVF